MTTSTNTALNQVGRYSANVSHWNPLGIKNQTDKYYCNKKIAKQILNKNYAISLMRSKKL